MILSMNWIGDFVDLSGLDKAALIHRFTLSTAEVEDILVKGEDTYGVIVGRILSCEAHPSSKKLHLLKIDTGAGVLDCVCGAPNAREGLKVAFATVGGAVSGHKIGEATIAGYPSFGMCCSGAELGISADNSGIMELPEDFPVGTDLKSLLPIDDLLFEVDNKSLTNRPDLWGHYGIAREIAALAGRPLKSLEVADLGAYKDLPPVSIEIKDPALAYRYMGVKVENILKNESPLSMQIRLFYCGSRAINLLADLTNYVMMEIGQPMHAFDLRRVDKIEVKRFEKPFSFRTLDGQDRACDENSLMICSGDTPVALAGIMGGLASEIEEDTTSLLLESACFDGVGIRKTSSRLGLRTDASMRYEKMLDPELCETAAARFLALLLAIDPGARVISAATDCYVTRYPVRAMTIDKPFVDRYTGINIPSDTIEKTLLSLGFGVIRDQDTFRVTVPSFRATKDVTIPADLIEEITRIYGYDNFDIHTPKGSLSPIRKDPSVDCDTLAKDLLVKRFSLHEVHSYIWYDAAKLKEIALTPDKNVKILNPQTPDHDTIRSSMTPTLLSFLFENRGYADAYGLFEIGRVVKGLKADGDCNEHKVLGIALYEKGDKEEALFLRLRDMITALFETTKHISPLFVPKAPAYSWEHPVNTFAVKLGEQEIGTLSVPHPTVSGAIDKRAVVAFAEVDMDAFAAAAPAAIRYEEAPRFPGMDIDLTFSLKDREIDFPTVTEAIRAAGGEMVKAVSFRDLFEKEDSLALTVGVTFRAADRTLKREEIQPAIEEITAAMAKLGYRF